MCFLCPTQTHELGNEGEEAGQRAQREESPPFPVTSGTRIGLSVADGPTAPREGPTSPSQAGRREGHRGATRSTEAGGTRFGSRLPVPGLSSLAPSPPAPISVSGPSGK